MKRRWCILALSPGTLGLLAGLAMEKGIVLNPILIARLQASSGGLVAFAGLATSVLALGACALWARWRRALAGVASDERQMQAESRRRFLRRLDHELKNPLTAIRAGLVNLQAAGAPAEATRASLANVRRQVERLSSLAADLRKLADLETREIERTPVDLEEVIREAVELVKALPGHGECPMRVNLQTIPWPLSPVEADRDLLLLALYNLLDNACKFGGPRATVEVRAAEDGARATLAVADTGPGIAAEDLPHLGEELYRGQDAAGVEGSGLGLALVKRIVARLDGEMAIRSRQGKGTVVTLRLPLGRR